jgi:hypothetical protein
VGAIEGINDTLVVSVSLMRVEFCDASFEWWASSAAAAALNITLGVKAPIVT